MRCEYRHNRPERVRQFAFSTCTLLTWDFRCLCLAGHLPSGLGTTRALPCQSCAAGCFPDLKKHAQALKQYFETGIAETQISDSGVVLSTCTCRPPASQTASWMCLLIASRNEPGLDRQLVTGVHTSYCPWILCGTQHTESLDSDRRSLHANQPSSCCHPS